MKHLMTCAAVIASVGLLAGPVAAQTSGSTTGSTTGSGTISTQTPSSGPADGSNPTAPISGNSSAVRAASPTSVTTTTSQSVTTESLQRLEGQTKFLQDGTHARVRGDRLIVRDANNVESPASEGTQTLQDGTTVDIGPGGVIRNMSAPE